ncbi:UMP kinase [Candidatus Roizmanbacteria bacterium]|nr:UMP kinase [Candidatus Roizmanbacteria bacterium]
MANNYSDTVVLKLGGSLIYPNGGLDVDYIKEFYKFIRKQVAEKNRRFFIFTGGGSLMRHYRDTGAEVTDHKLTKDDLDWLGIHVTRLNAHLFRTIFRDLAHPNIIFDYDTIQKTDKPIVIAAGWKPGWSTDYDAVVLAQDYHVNAVLKMGNTDFVYDKDPRDNPDAKPFHHMSWAEYIKLVGAEWVPGKHTPFDPIAAKLALELKIKAYFLNGKDLPNAEKAINGEKFIGTIIE